MPFADRLSELNVGGKYFCFLDSLQQICYAGTAQLTVLLGTVWINGYKLRAGSSCGVHCPSGFLSHFITANKRTLQLDSLICVHSLQRASNGKVRKKSLLLRKLKSANLSRFEYIRVRRRIRKLEHCKRRIGAVICFEPCMDTVRGVLAASRQFNHLYKDPFSLEIVENCRQFSLPSSWRKFVRCVRTFDSTYPPVILVCGGKDVGKSTFCRYLVNTLLNRCAEVAFLETDVGQTELTAPAILALNRLKKPLLGPTFSHQQQPDFGIYFGEVTPADRPSFYLQCIAHLFNCYIEVLKPAGIPLVVNTHGWVKGLGLVLLLELLQVIQPSYVVQFESTSPSKNLPPLSDELWSQYIGATSFLPDEFKEASDWTPHVFCLPVEDSYFSPIATNSFQLSAVMLRQLALVSSLSHLLYSFDSSPEQCLRSARTLALPWCQVAIHVLHCTVPRSQMLYAFNGSVVAMAKADKTSFVAVGRDKFPDAPYFLDEDPVVNYLDLGVVRAVDMENKLFYILTSLPEESFAGVNVLLKGCLELLPSFLQFTGEEDVPYISSQFSTSVIGSTMMKKRANLKR